MRLSLSKALFALAAASGVSISKAVLYGDENYLDLEGRFWSFYSYGVAIIDPDTCAIEKTITKDNDGNDLPEGWSDGIYMQKAKTDDEGFEGYVLINSRVDRTNATGDRVSDVYILSTSTEEVEAVVEVGPRVVHAYGVHNREEFWTHSDGDGHFYVIDLSDISSHESKVKAHQVLPFHGKLLWDEDGTLGDRGFATSTGEPYLFEVDLAKATLTKSYDYSTFVIDGTCGGLHAIAYSAKNKHIYAECTEGGGGTVEFDVGNAGIEFVAQHVDATGALYEVPDGTYVVASNKGGDMLHVFKPNGNGVASSIQYNVAIPGHPDTPSFYPTDGVEGGADFIACMPLTSNPNAKQIDADGNVVCDYFTGCTGASTATDVSNGICLHEDNSTQLMRVTEVVTDMAACERCSDESNFNNSECICTPDCGSCDVVVDVDLNKTGVACIDLGDVVDGKSTEAKLISNAGAVSQGAPYEDSPECTFGRTYRSHKRGRMYDASVSNFPTDSIVIVNMLTQEVHCQVELPGVPSRVVYAPTTPQAVEGVGATGITSVATKNSWSAIVLLIVTMIPFVTTMTMG